MEGIKYLWILIILVGLTSFTSAQLKIGIGDFDTTSITITQQNITNINQNASSANLTNVAFTNQSNTFDSNQTITADLIVESIFATFYNWVTSGAFLSFDGLTLSFDNDLLNATIDDIINQTQLNATATIDFTNVAFVNKSVNDSQIFLQDQAITEGRRWNYRGALANDTYFFYNASNGTLQLVANGILQQSWGASTTIFESLDVLGVSTLTNLTVINVAGEQVTIDANLNVTGNTTASIYFGSGADLTGVCLSNGTNCVAVSSTGKAGDPPFLFNDTNTIFFNATLLNATIDDRAGEDNNWNVTNDSLFPSDISNLVGIGLTNPNASLEIFSAPENFSVEICEISSASCYRFELEILGDLAFDSSTNQNLGLISGAVRTNSSGQNGTGNLSLLFEVGDFVHASSIEANTFLTGNFSIAAWVNKTSATEGFIISKITNATNKYSLHIDNSQRVFFSVLRNGVFSGQRTSTSISLSEWTHVAGVFFSNGTLVIYINGEEQGLVNNPSQPVGTATDLFIGINSILSSGWVGELDEIGMVDLGLTSDNISQVASQGFNLIPFNITRAQNVSYAISQETFGDIFIVNKFGRVGLNVGQPSFTLEVNNTARFLGDVVIEEDLFLQGTLVGGSPVKIAGGLEVQGGMVNFSNSNVTIGNLTSSFFNWVSISPYLIFDGMNLTLNDTYLNLTIDDRDAVGSGSDTWFGNYSAYLNITNFWVDLLAQSYYNSSDFDFLTFSTHANVNANMTLTYNQSQIEDNRDANDSDTITFDTWFGNQSNYYTIPQTYNQSQIEDNRDGNDSDAGSNTFSGNYSSVLNSTTGYNQSQIDDNMVSNDSDTITFDTWQPNQSNFYNTSLTYNQSQIEDNRDGNDTSGGSDTFVGNYSSVLNSTTGYNQSQIEDNRDANDTDTATNSSYRLVTNSYNQSQIEDNREGNDSIGAGDTFAANYSDNVNRSYLNGYGFYNSTLVNATQLEDQSGNLGIDPSFLENIINAVIDIFSTIVNSNINANITRTETNFLNNDTTLTIFVDANILGNASADGNGTFFGNYSITTNTSITYNQTNIDSNILSNASADGSPTFVGTNYSTNINDSNFHTTNSSYAAIDIVNTGSLNVTGNIISEADIGVNQSSAFCLNDQCTSNISNNGTHSRLR